MGFKTIMGTACVCLASVSFNASAALIKIDFEEIDNTSGDTTSGDSLDTHGFNFNYSSTNGDGILHWGKNNSYNADQGGVTYSHNHPRKTSILTQTSGDSFNLMSIDFGDVFNDGTSQQIRIDAVYTLGGSFTTIITTDAVAGLQTFALNLHNVDSVSWVETTGNYLQLDNVSIETSPVPIPSAVWLFGSGLIGLIGLARRKA
jgi:hypothetical protein